MDPWLTVDRAPISDGGELVLSARGDEFAIRLDGQELMISASHDSEEKLAVLGCAGLRDVAGARVLIGGLGMGYTARAAFGQLADDAEVEVIELIGAVVRPGTATSSGTSRARRCSTRGVRVIEGDVADVIEGARNRYDANLLDVDNGPQAFTSRENKRLYTFIVCLDRVRQPRKSPWMPRRVVNSTQSLVPRPAHAVSSAPVRDRSLSCRLPPASFASWLPSLKSRIVLDQVAVRAPTTQPIFGKRSC